jgi:hypothetical protein
MFPIRCAATRGSGFEGNLTPATRPSSAVGDRHGGRSAAAEIWCETTTSTWQQAAKPMHVNHAEFEAAAFQLNRDRAIGRQPDGSASGGMITAAIVEVPTGASLCRITHSALPAELSLTSPWWAYKTDFELILSRSLSIPSDFRELLRNSLALAGDYTIPDQHADEIRAKYGREALRTLKNFADIRPYDRIFEIEVTADLLAFTGIGRDVTDTRPDSALGILRTWTAAADIRQLFIPGLRDADGGLSNVGRAGMHYRRSLNLAHWIEIAC